jgi:hypothetical protein
MLNRSVETNGEPWAVRHRAVDNNDEGNVRGPAAYASRLTQRASASNLLPVACGSTMLDAEFNKHTAKGNPVSLGCNQQLETKWDKK